MEELGIVSSADGNKPRKVLITMEEYLETKAILFGQCEKAAVLIDSSGAKRICEATKGELFTCSCKEPETAYAAIAALDACTMKGSCRFHGGFRVR